MIRLEPRFAELAAMTNFSFLRGASHPEEMVARAAELGLAGIGIADRNSLAGVVRAHTFARDNAEAMAGTRVVPGARLVFIDGSPDVLAYPKDRAAYGRLCRILTEGNLRAPKGECWLILKDLLDRSEGLQIVALPPSPKDDGENASLSQKDKEKLDYKEMDESAALALLRQAFGETSMDRRGPDLWRGHAWRAGGARCARTHCRRALDCDQRRADAHFRAAHARRRPHLHTRENNARGRWAPHSNQR